MIPPILIFGKFKCKDSFRCKESYLEKKKKPLWRPSKYEAVFHILVKKEMQVGEQYVERNKKILNKGLNFALPKLRQ